MRAIMMSIQPKWVEKILNGEKTIEVRKTAPKFEKECSKLADECGEMYREPFKVYIYCTKGGKKDIIVPMKNDKFTGDILNGKVVAEFTCDRIYYIAPCRDFDTGYCVSYEFRDCEYGTANHCLLFKELDAYLKGNYGYAWHISDLKIYDKPRELGEFKSIKAIRGYHKKNESKIERLQHGDRVEVKAITRPPQSWCYCEESDK